MKYIVIKEKKIDNEFPMISGIWYVVRIKNPILHFLANIIEQDYKLFRDKEKAIECAKLKSMSKYDYNIQYGKVWG